MRQTYWNHPLIPTPCSSEYLRHLQQLKLQSVYESDKTVVESSSKQRIGSTVLMRIACYDVSGEKEKNRTKLQLRIFVLRTIAGVAMLSRTVTRTLPLKFKVNVHLIWGGI